MMRIKQIPEDFVVKELSSVGIKAKGDYSYFSLRKKGWNTPDVVDIIAKKAGIDEKRIGFAGNKDKSAITEQLLSFYKVNTANIGKLRINDIELKFIGYGDERINLGCLNGNEFVITIRDLDKKIEKNISEIINYFDEQRFGISGKNINIGKMLIKKDFKQACEILGIAVEKNDYIGSLRKYGVKKLRFFINAYQSFLWNKLVSSLINQKEHFCINYSLGTLSLPKVKLRNKKIAVPGFLCYKSYEEIFREEKITREDFVMRQMPELSSEGGIRDMIVKVSNFKTISFEKDELNKGKFKQTVAFKLQKGSYATIVVKSLGANI